MLQLIQRIVVVVFALGLPSISSKGRNVCTSGFMSVDRIDTLIRTKQPAQNHQIIFPEASFTCMSGKILRLVFGAKIGNSGSPLLPELQTWKTIRNNVYSKVDKISFNVTLNTTGFYNYTLPSPMKFEAGDVLGYYQPSLSQSKLRVYFGGNGGDSMTRYVYSGYNSADELDLLWGEKVEGSNLMLYLITDPPNCVRNFMSVKRIKLILGVEAENEVHNFHDYQLISPYMVFTCNGIVTKWIVGSRWFNYVDYDSVFPELQVWRKTLNNTYKKIGGTRIFAINKGEHNIIYEYSHFKPIMVQTGDILGIFSPLQIVLSIYFERNENSSALYYKSGDFSAREVDIKSLYIWNSYHPLVSAKIVTTMHTQLVTTIPAPSTSISSTKVISGSDISSGNSNCEALAAGVGVGVAVFLTLLCVNALIMMFLLDWRNKRLKDVARSQTSPVDTALTETTCGTTMELHEAPYQSNRVLQEDDEIPENNGTETPNESASPIEYHFENNLYEEY